METKWKAKKKKKKTKTWLSKCFIYFFTTEGGNTFLLIDNEESIFRFTDAFAFIYQHSYATDET